MSISGGILNDTAADGSIRLVNGSGPHKGRVEIFLLGHWGTVCDNGWDLNDATVVCHQLGYLRAVEAPRSATFGAGSGPSWYSDVRCGGTELNLIQCRKYDYYYYFGNACSHSKDAGVVCSSKLHVLSVPSIHRSVLTSCEYRLCDVNENNDTNLDQT